MDPDRPSTSGGSDERIVEIFHREIEREIANKMVALTNISDNIRKCQKDLDRLRKEATTKFYMDSIQKYKTVEQHSIHPAVKKLIGKRPAATSLTDQYLKANIWGWSRETRRKSLRKYSLSNHNHKRKNPQHSVKENLESVAEPRYIPPKIPGNPQENSSLRGNTKKMHMRVLVGNVAKQVESVIEDSATHKWMVYVRSAPGSLEIEKQVSKVRFFLHPSYKPHDVVTVPSPPFTLNRRGWGEFLMRVQLYFKNHLNKTVDIFHNLKLNGAISGLYERSAETFADLWVYPHEEKSERRVDAGGSAEQILWLATDLLKEVMPDFSSEVMCHRCHIRSSGSDSYSCVCASAKCTDDSDSEVSAATEDAISQSASKPVSDESDSDDSDESYSGAKFLGRITTVPFEDVDNDDNDSDDNDNSNGEDEFENSTSKMSPEFIDCGKQDSSEADEENIDEEEHRGKDSPSPSETKVDCVNGVTVFKTESSEGNEGSESLRKALSANKNVVNDKAQTLKCKESEGVDNNIDRGPIDSHDSIYVKNQWIKTELDCSDTKFKPSEILDALEIKQETVENTETAESSVNEGVGDIIHENSVDANQISEGNKVIVDTEDEVFIKEEVVETEVVYDYQHDKSVEIPVQYSESQSSDMDNIYETNSLTPQVESFENLGSHSVESSSLVIEEIPIDEFIDNIEEEVEVEIPENFTNDPYAGTEVRNNVIDSPSKQINNVNDQTLKEDSYTFGDALTTQKHRQVGQKSTVNQDIPIGVANCYKKLKMDETIILTTARENETLSANKIVLNPRKSIIVQTITPTDVSVSSNDMKKRLNSDYLIKKTPQICQSLLKSSIALSGTSILKRNSLLKPSVQKYRILGSTSSQSLLKSHPNNLNTAQSQNSQNLSIVLKDKVQTSGTQVVGGLLNRIKPNIPNSPNDSVKIVQCVINNPALDSLSEETHVKNFSGNPSLQNVQTQPKIILANTVLKPSVRNVHGQTKNNVQSLTSTVQQSASVPRFLRKPNRKKSPAESPFFFVKNAQNQPKPFAINRILIPCNIDRYQPRTSLIETVKNHVTQNSNPHTVQSLIQTPQNVLKNSFQNPLAHSSDKNLGPQQIIVLQNCVNSNLSDKSPKKIQSSLVKSNAKDLKETNSIPQNDERKSTFQNVQIESTRSLNMPLVLPNIRVPNPNTSSSDLGNLKDVVSFDEVVKTLQLPSVLLSVKQVALDCQFLVKLYGSQIEPLLSCNNLHSEFRTLISVRSDFHFGRKVVAANKDYMNTTTSEEIYYYIEQLRLLMNTCPAHKRENGGGVEEVVRWLVRGLPLVQADASQTAFKMVHPYCTTSVATYCSWPAAKQAASEWLRAKRVSRLLEFLQDKGLLSGAWSTQAVYQWSRLNGYSPAVTLNGPEPADSNDEKYLHLLQKKTPPDRVLLWLSSVLDRRKLKEEEIDVVGVEIPEEREGAVRDSSEAEDEGEAAVCGQPWVRESMAWVRGEARRVGARLGLEPLTPDAPHQAVSATLLSHITMGFAEDLLRRSLQAAFDRDGGSVAVRDICTAIFQRPEFDLFTKRGLDIDSSSTDFFKRRKPKMEPPE